MTRTRIGHNACPILERTADGSSCGRCWFHCPDGVCPRHGDVSAQLEHYRKTGELSEDPRMAGWGFSPLT